MADSRRSFSGNRNRNPNLGKNREHNSGEGSGEAPDLRRYAEEMQAMLRLRDPAAYRVFVAKWRDLHQRGAAEQLLKMDDDALRLRIEHMILSTPSLTDLHPVAREDVAT